jgi:MFS family permease
MALPDVAGVEAVPGPSVAAEVPVWRNRDFMLLWSGQAVSTLGSRISGVAFPLLILALTNSFEAAGIASALSALPYALFSLPAGALVDRWDRKRVMILCDTGRAINMGSIPLALVFGGPWLWQIYVVAFIEGTLFVFFNIAQVAALPRIVAKGQIASATGQNQAAEATANLVGPGLGGFLYASVSRMFPFVLDAVSYAVSVVSLLFVKSDFQKERVAKERHLGREIKEGVAWLWSHPVVRFMAFLNGAGNFVGAATFLIIIARAREMGGKEDVIGLIFSIGAIGGIAGALVGGRIGKHMSFGRIIVTMVWIQALLLPLLALAPNVFALGTIFALSYLTIPIYNVAAISYRLSLVPDELQGRVSSASRMIAYGFQPLGATLAGFLLEKYNPTLAVAVFAAWLLTFAIAASLNSHLRNA